MTDADMWWGSMPPEVANRFLGRCATTAIPALAEAGGTVIVPVGATEQHGPHLPLFTDTLIVQSLVAGALVQLPADHPFYFIYPVGCSYSMEHVDFPGTIALSADTTMRVLMDIGESLARSGFKKMVLINGHGGNLGLLHVVARELRIRTGLRVFMIHAGSLMDKAELSELEATNGLHAGTAETALLMSLTPSWVNAAKATSEYPQLTKHLGVLSVEGQFPVAWKTKDVSESGVIGDATLATADMGQRLHQSMVDKLIAVLGDIAAFEPA